MDHGDVAVASPPPRVYRVARCGGDPFAPPPWDRAGPDGTFGGRFDDPSADRGLTIHQRFRAVYCATTTEGAFGETVARFRPSITLLAKLQEIDDEEESGAGPGFKAEPGLLAGGVVPADWRIRRHLAQTELEPTLQFVDLAAPRTHQYLRRVLAPTISALGASDLDFGTVVGPHRALTQHCARAIYELRAGNDAPAFAGIRYLSRLNPEWECWAIFADRLARTSWSATAIASDHPDLRSACGLLGLSIETISGQ
ncbi:MAG: hypothetical protein K0Q71_3493 [Thermomicrobiales bacterium]|nr:hypothetical protein [Thermomicrobiales bacterium]